MNTPALKILLIEDSAGDAQRIEDELSNQGFNCDLHRVESLSESDNALFDTDWELILCDCQPPRFSANKALEMLGKSKSDIPLIAISRVIDEQNASDLLANGAQEFVNKSNLSRLGPAITRALKGAARSHHPEIPEHDRNESDARFREIVNSLQESVIVMDSNACVTYWNPAAEQLFGYSSEQILGKPLHEHIAPKRYRQAFVTAFAHFLKTGRGNIIGRRINIEALRADKSEFPAELAINAIYLNGAWSAIGVVRDLSNEDAIREQNARICILQLREEALTLDSHAKLFELFLDTLLTADFLPVSGNGAIFEVDPAGKQFSLISNKGEWQTSDCRQGSENCLCRVAVQWRKIAFSAAVDSGPEGGCCSLRNEYTYYGFPLITDGGVLKGVCLTSVDTDYQRDREIEDLLMRMGTTMANLIESSQSQRIVKKLTTAVEQSPTSIFISDKHGIIEYANPKVSQLTGFTHDEIIGNTPSMFKSGLNPDAIYKDLWETVVAGQNWSGELQNKKKDGELFWEAVNISPIKDNFGQITHFIAIKEDITLRKTQERKLNYLSTHHPLSNLPNRALTMDRLKQAILQARRYDAAAAVLSLDLNQLSLINDNLGHQAGDEVIRLTGRRLEDAVRRSDTVGHTGGDEFVVILSQPDSKESVLELVEKIQDSINCPIEIKDRQVDVTCSIGVALFPEDGESADELLRHSDAAMYHAKSRGKNKSEFYSKEMDRSNKERLNVLHELQRAIDQKELVLHYQPLLDAVSGTMIGAEALVRWLHPKRGLIPPGDFIGIAEEEGLIGQIGDYVLKAACMQNMAWQRSGLPLIPISVNVSAHQVHQLSLVDSVAEALRLSGMDPAFLDIELTESVMMENLDQAIPLLRQLKSMGVTLSGDDFGTGYTSLSYLKKLPLDRIKIDREFINEITTDPDDAVITNAIIKLGHGLNFKVLAEGVETKEQLAYLRKCGCDELQGFYFSRPVPAKELEPLMTKRQWFEPERAERESILLLDDEEPILKALQRVLRRDRYKIYATTSPAEGFSLLAKHKIGLVICDQRMPLMSGVEFLTRVKDIHPATIRIILSGHSDIESVIEAINKGSIYKFLFKPWDDNQLREHVREVMNLHRIAADENNSLGKHDNLQ